MARSEVKMVQGSIEYLYADIRADQVLSDQPVFISVSTTSTPVAWVVAQWIGSPGKYRSARVLLDGTLLKGAYHVFGRLIDDPEAPIVYIGLLKII